MNIGLPYSVTDIAKYQAGINPLLEEFYFAYCVYLSTVYIQTHGMFLSSDLSSNVDLAFIEPLFLPNDKYYRGAIIVVLKGSNWSLMQCLMITIKSLSFLCHFFPFFLLLHLSKYKSLWM